MPFHLKQTQTLHQTFILSIIRSRMLPPLVSDAKDNHPTFLFSIIQSRMFPPFISDAKDKHQTFLLSVIRSRMLPPFISDAKDNHPTFILASYGAECYRHLFPTVKANTQHLFQRHTEPNVTAIYFRR